MEIAARIGWIARGALYVLIGVLVGRLPSTAGEHVDKRGAFAELARSPFGGWTLGAVAVGMAGFAVWRLWAAIRGTDEKTNRRLGWVASSVAYAALSVLAFGVLMGRGSKGGQEKTLTARVLAWPGGQLIVAAVGLGLLAIAANYVRKGIQESFLHDVDTGAVPDRVRPMVTVVGVAGWLGRALVWALVGWFVVQAAVQRDASEPVGLDETLHKLVGESYGPALLWVACAGMLAFALLCFATATWPDPDPDG
jgi:hypothetical protein